MANNLIYTINLANTLGSGYDAGDAVEIYYDDVADSIRVYIDAVEQLSGPNISLSDISSASDPSYQFCDVNDLVKFLPNTASGSIFYFPYMKKVIIEDSPSCSGVSVDLEIVSIVTTPDNGSGNGSATITVTTSAGVVQYALTDFSFRDGEGQSSNVFSGLSSGVYTVHVKDSDGAYLKKDFTIALEPEYGPKYRAEYVSDGVTCRFDVEEMGYSGSIEDVKLAREVNYVCQTTDIQSIYNYSIRPSYCKIELLSDSDQKYIGLYTSQPKKIRGVYYRDGQEFWRGYLTPSVFSEPYRNAPYVTSFTFIDGLTYCKNLLASDVSLSGSPSLMQIVVACLAPAVELNIHEAIHVYAARMDSNSGMLSQTTIDWDTFLRDEDITCWDVLDWICMSFNAELVQQDGAWWIVRKEYRTQAFTYYSFDSSGASTGSGTYDAPIPLACYDSLSRIAMRDQDQLLSIMPAYGQIVFKNNLDVRESILNNYDFEELSETSSSGFNNWIYVLNGSDAYMTQESTSLGISAVFNGFYIVNVNVRDAYLQSTATTIRYSADDRVKLRLKFGFNSLDDAIPFVILKMRIKVGSKYLTDDLQWSSSPSTFRAYPKYAGSDQSYQLEFKLPTVTEETTETIQFSIYYFNAGQPEYGTSVDLAADVATVDKKSGYRIDKQESFLFGNVIDYYELVPGGPGDGDVVPADNASSNKVWNRVARIKAPDILDLAGTGTIVNSKMFIDEVEIDYIHNGQEVVEEQIYNVFTDDLNPEKATFEMNVGDLPILFEEGQTTIYGDTLTPNDPYSYRSHYKNTLGGYLLKWGRKGINEAVRLQNIFVNTIITQHRTQTQVISGSFTGKQFGGGGIFVKPLNSVYDTFGDKYYLVEGIRSYDVMEKTELEIVEIKSGGSVGEFSEFDRDEFDNNEFN